MFYVAYATTPTKGVKGQSQAGTRGVTGQTQATGGAQLTRATGGSGITRVRPGRR